MKVSGYLMVLLAAGSLAVLSPQVGYACGDAAAETVASADGACAKAATVVAGAQQSACQEATVAKADAKAACPASATNVSLVSAEQKGCACCEKSAANVSLVSAEGKSGAASDASVKPATVVAGAQESSCCAKPAVAQVSGDKAASNVLLVSAEDKAHKHDKEGKADKAKLSEWRAFLSPEQLHEKLGHANLVVIDVRSAKEYAAGHIPGAINLPGDEWRTPSVKPGKGDSQYIFRTAGGEPDVARYEKWLGKVGLTRDHKVVIYGSHGGKADGSVPAMILDWLGQKKVAFLDGVGLERWQKTGYEVSKEPKTLKPAKYEAQPRPHFVWNLKDVVNHLGKKDVVFYDTRSVAEYEGKDLRDNERGGHIPGAVLLDYAEFLTKDNTTPAPAEVAKKLEQRGITPDKTVVLYCQTATRVSLPYLALRDLGYPNVAIYDGSWHEYGNRPDTPIEGETTKKLAESQKAEANGNSGS